MTSKARRRRWIIYEIESLLLLPVVIGGVLLLFAIPEMICRMLGVAA